MFGILENYHSPVHRTEGHICKYFVNNNIVPTTNSNWVAFMRWCFMVWIVILFSEMFWFKWLLMNSNLMFACLSGFSLGFTTDRRRNCQEGSLHFSMSSSGVTLSSCYENSWDICCSLQTVLSWAYFRDRLPSVHCRTFGWHWEILWLYC